MYKSTELPWNKLRLSVPALLVALLMAFFAQELQALPAVFSDYSLNQAKERAGRGHKYLLVEFTASGCVPCKKMDATTWTDASIIRWIRENAIAIQLDSDKEKEAASELKIRAMPTIVIFAPEEYSKVFDRDTGYKNSHDLLTWLTSVKLGKTTGQIIEEKANAMRGKGDHAEVQARYDLARRLLTDGKYKEATDEFVWLWRNIPKQDPPMIAVRNSFMILEMIRLLHRFPDAKPLFEELRTEAEKSDTRVDWVKLNGLLNESDKTLAWFDSIKDRPDHEQVIHQVDATLQSLLIRANRWADIGTYLYKEPMKKLEQLKQQSLTAKRLHKERRTGLPGEPTARDYDPFPASAATLYAALLAAGREAEAEQIVSESFKFDDTRELRNKLAERAYKAGQSRPEQLKWLEEVRSNTVKNEDFYDDRASVFREIKHNELALKDYDHLIELSSRNGHYYCQRGCVLFDLGQYRRAVDDFSQAIKLDPKCASPIQARACALYKLGDYDSAMADFSRALEIDPNDSMTWSNKADMYFHMSKYSEAFDAATKALDLDPYNTCAIANKGEAALRLGRYDEALSLLTKAIQRGPDVGKAESYFYRGELYEKIGKPELARVDKDTAKKLGFHSDEKVETHP